MASGNIPVWVQNRILGFFNQARNVDMILDGSIQDDPSDGKGSKMGPTLAARILRTKNELPHRRFMTFEELDDIRGVGQNTLQDLVYSFGKTADEAFQTAMYKSGTIYKDNWPLEYFRYSIDDRAEFETLAKHPNRLRAFVIDKLREACANRGVVDPKQDQMVEELSNAYIDAYNNSSSVAAYALALWFYEFDADNWFSWEQIQEQTLLYFAHHANTDSWQMDLHFFKGFVDRGLLRPGISPEDLPVVVNWAEQTITFWVSALYD